MSSDTTKRQFMTMTKIFNNEINEEHVKQYFFKI